MIPALSLCALLVLSARPAPHVADFGATKAARRALKKRTLQLNDDSGVVEIHVAGGTPTTLTFAVDVNEERLLLADTRGRFFDPQTVGRTLVLVPKEDLPKGDAVTLQVTLADGTLLPFMLTTTPNEVDLALDVELDFKKRHAPESLAALKTSVAELQGRLDECQSTGAEQGTVRVASLILSQEPTKPEAFTVERHPARALDKQSRLLVQLHTVYRLFDYSYLVLTLENRDATHAWVLERAEVSSTDGGGTTQTRVVAVAQELTVIAPGETSRVVVGFSVPSQEAGQKWTLKLLEKGGARHVALSF